MICGYCSVDKTSAWSTFRWDLAHEFIGCARDVSVLRPVHLSGCAGVVSRAELSGWERSMGQVKEDPCPMKCSTWLQGSTACASLWIASWLEVWPSWSECLSHPLALAALLALTLWGLRQLERLARSKVAEPIPVHEDDGRRSLGRTHR